MAATGAFALVAVTAKPGGGAATKSPWLAQTRSSLGTFCEHPRLVVRARHQRVTELSMRGAANRAAQHVGHQLHPVADAERGQPHVAGPRGRDAGRRLRERCFGPPERMMPLGCFARIAAIGVLKGRISEYTESSRNRRAMSCVNCEPKSRTRMV